MKTEPPAAHQVRTSTGFTNAPGGVLRLPPGWGRVRIASVWTGIDLAAPAAPVAVPAGGGADRLLRLLEAIAAGDDVVPRTDDLARQLGLSGMATRRVARWLRELEDFGAVRLHVRGGTRAIELVRLGVVVSNRDVPQVVGGKA